MKHLKTLILTFGGLGCNALFGTVYLQNASSVLLDYNNGTSLDKFKEMELSQDATKKPVTVKHKNKTTTISKNGWWFFSDHGVYFKPKTR